VALVLEEYNWNGNEESDREKLSISTSKLVSLLLDLDQSTSLIINSHKTFFPPQQQQQQLQQQLLPMTANCASI